MKKALFSGWLAAVATHTALARSRAPGHGPARSMRGRSSASTRAMPGRRRASRREAAPLLRGLGVLDGPGRRSRGGRRGTGPSLPSPTSAPPSSACARARPCGCALGEAPLLASAPAVRGREIVRSEALLGPDGRAAQFIGGVSAPVLARLLEEARDVGALCAAYNAAAPPWWSGALLRALATLVAAAVPLRVRLESAPEVFPCTGCAGAGADWSRQPWEPRSSWCRSLARGPARALRPDPGRRPGGGRDGRGLVPGRRGHRRATASRRWAT